MSIDQHQTIKLIVNRAIVILKDNRLIETERYSSTDKGVYVLVEDYAKALGMDDPTIPVRQKLIYFPYTSVKAVLYDVTESDSKQKDDDISSAQFSNVG